MVAAGLDRQSFVIGLGGGMIGDISGFVAAIYHRGIPHVQIPTTLLAMVDSSIGGKTAVNTADGKNLIGAFHDPSLVIDDVEVLKTLPAREFNQGFAEIIKHAVIADAEMFGELKNTRARSPRRPLALQSLIKRNVEIKSKIVAKDERDQTGKRAILNFGHTIGHAIERAGDYRKFLHGEAVSLGIVAACAISTKKGGTPARSARCNCRSSAAIQFTDAIAESFSARENHRNAKVRQKIRRRKRSVCCDAAHWFGAARDRCHDAGYPRSD